MLTKDFDLGDVLSITTGRLVSHRHMDGIYDVLNFMTGDDLMTHQLPRSAEEMKPRLLAQHPYLAGTEITEALHGLDILLNTPNGKRDAAKLVAGWLVTLQTGAYGVQLPAKVSVRAEHQFHEVRDPIAEAEQRFGPDNIITVVKP